MAKSKVVIEMEFDSEDSINRERLMEIAGDVLYRADVNIFDPIGDESNDWEQLTDAKRNNDVAFRYHSFADSKNFDNYSKLYEAFLIFAKYDHNVFGGIASAKHDEIYSGPDPEIVSDEDKERLKELGWNDYGDGCFHRFA